MHLNAVPGNLNSIIPPRMRNLGIPVPSIPQEVRHALGSSHTHIASKLRIAH